MKLITPKGHLLPAEQSFVAFLEAPIEKVPVVGMPQVFLKEPAEETLVEEYYTRSQR